ncbi:fatty-acid amide hydrolase 2-A isoform X2 [Drosophila ficusphila]|uniref:fatty-acid amide hydrolase 2-A isoform X2 n=1 Tax=Drosophila ficusphila TaxID=30025 RepID=UPI001C8A0F7D|nr:fatty-acid amide hydrolase 2-A isoform X2 [Drosophila ficusphila]
MEIFIRLIVVVIKAIAMIISPILDTYFYPRKPRTTLIPPIRNKLLTLSVQELRSRLRSRQLTSVELVRTYIERIESVNKHLNAIVESRFSAALEEASETDDLIASCQSLADVEKLFEERPLLGLPVTIKESCALEGMTFSVGSLARRDIKAEADGEAVKRLKSAGAIPLLVSATPEYCFSIETDTLLNGRCLNPYDFERTPGGSSGGQGALNGAGASLFGIGSDIGGSIRIPSLYCGLFGHKPSGGVVSVKGHFPNSKDPNIEHYLVEGPMTRFAVDLSELLQIMAGKDNSNKLRLNEPVQLNQIKVQYALGFEGLNGLMHTSVDKDIRGAICRATTHLKTLGLEVQKAKLPNLDNSMEMALSGIAGQDLMDYLMEYQDAEGTNKVRQTFWELIKSLRGHSNYTTNALIFELMRRAGAFMSQSKMNQYLEEARGLIGEFAKLLGDNGVLIFPTLNLPAPRHKWSVFSLWGVDYTLLFNVLGLPVTHVPMGLNDRGLPVGLSVIGAPNQDRLCIRVAVELERAFGGWKPPVPHELDD